MSKKEKVLEVMAKHPKWKISRVAKTAKCSESFAYLVRNQAKAEERHAALVELAELDAERRASTQAATSVLVLVHQRPLR